MPHLGAVVARNVAGERVRRRWTRTQLANRLGWTPTALGAIETGTRKVTVDDLPPLCRAFGVSIVDLLRGGDPEDIEALRISSAEVTSGLWRQFR